MVHTGKSTRVQTLRSCPLYSSFILCSPQSGFFKRSTSPLWFRTNPSTQQPEQLESPHELLCRVNLPSASLLWHSCSSHNRCSHPIFPRLVLCSSGLRLQMPTRGHPSSTPPLFYTDSTSHEHYFDFLLVSRHPLNELLQRQGSRLSCFTFCRPQYRYT